nr:hypothetical protein [uncultured Flavobacterium sp.]
MSIKSIKTFALKTLIKWSFLVSQKTSRKIKFIKIRIGYKTKKIKGDLSESVLIKNEIIHPINVKLIIVGIIFKKL